MIADDLKFLVVGFQKCGTSTLHTWLSKEDSVCLPLQKETHFFSHDDRFENGFEWYSNQFEKKKNCIYGEVDPEYIYWPDAAKRIGALGIKVKIVILLREPKHRMVSHYKMSVRRGIEQLSFIDAVNTESSRKSKDKEQYMKHYSYLERSLYSEQIERFKKHCPNCEYLFVSFESLFSDRRADEYKKICDFIGFKSTINKEILEIKENEAKDAKYDFVNKIIWDKSKFKKLRNISSKFLSKELKWKIFNFLYTKNAKKMKDGVIDKNLPIKVEEILSKENKFMDELFTK